MGQEIRSTETSKVINASCSEIYNALTNPSLIVQWQVPGQMSGKIHRFKLEVGSGYEMSLYYPESDKHSVGKSGVREDRFSSRFLELSPAKKIKQAINFQSQDTELKGEMIMEISLDAIDNKTIVVFKFLNIPKGISLKDNEEGTKSSLQKLAHIVESPKGKK